MKITKNFIPSRLLALFTAGVCFGWASDYLITEKYGFTLLFFVFTVLDLYIALFFGNSDDEHSN